MADIENFSSDDLLTSDAQYFDYGSAANPIRQGIIPPVPYRTFSPAFFDEGPTRVQPLDVSKELGIVGPATSPALCANFIRIDRGSVMTSAEATSQVFFVFRGNGRTDACGETMQWSQGDYMVLPAHGHAMHHSDGEAGLLLGARCAPAALSRCGAVGRALQADLYQHSKAQQKLAEIASDPKTASANRVSVLLANKNFPATRTITHTMWTMFGLLPKDKIQYPHRHESVALDFVIDCKPGCYTMIGTELDETGMIKNGRREDWAPGASFITPPGYWHSHHNESGADAHVLPIQDAGLHTYLRTLEITFSHPGHDRTAHISQTP